MSTSNARKIRKARQACHYTAEEREVFNKYKEEYRSQTTKEQRGHILKTQILPDLFNYWTNDGAVPLSDAEACKRVKVCTEDEENHC
jgi:hypothetical protein